MKSTHSINKSKDLCGLPWLQLFALFIFCLGSLPMSSQKVHKEIQKINPVELINSMEQVSPETAANQTRTVIDTHGQLTTHASKSLHDSRPSPIMALPEGMENEIIRLPGSDEEMSIRYSQAKEKSFFPAQKNRSSSTFQSTRKRPTKDNLRSITEAKRSGTSQNRGSRSSASTDTDADGIPDSIDLCPDYMDTALDFDGIDDHVTVPYDAALNVSVGDFTFQAWVNPTYKNNGWYTILSNGVGGVAINYWFFFSDYSFGLYYGDDWRSVDFSIPKNEWSHVAVTLNGATKQATFYINGVAQPAPLPFSLSPDTSYTSPLIIGNLPPTNYNAFKGRMDDVAIWNTIRTAEEIAYSMSNSIDGSEAGLVAIYDMNESAACMDNTATTMIVDQSPNDFGGQLNNFSLLPGCTSNWSSGRNLDSDQNGFGDGCDDFWFDSDFDGTPDSIDLCPYYMNVALNFDGNNDHVSVPHDVALNVGGGDFTLQAWVKPTGNHSQTILSKGSGDVAATTDYVFQIDTSFKQGLFYADAWQYGNTVLPTNMWSHVAVTFNFATKQATFYLNGVADGVFSYPGTARFADMNPLFIGRQGYDCTCNFFEGQIDDVAIWNTTRTAAEIACSMASTPTGSEAGLMACYDMNESAACIDNITANMAADQSPNGFDGLLNNFSLLSGCTSNWSPGRNLDSDQDGLGDGCSACFNFDSDSDGIPDSIDFCPNYMDVALDFDGINDHITVPHDTALNVVENGQDFTFQAWIFPTSNANNTIISKGVGFGFNTEYIFQIAGSPYRMGLYLSGEWQYGTANIPLNQWSHVAVSVDGPTKTAHFYLNGLPDGSPTFATTSFTSGITTALFIGRQGFDCNCNYFEGRIDDLAIWNTTRTAAEIRNDMATKIGGYEAGLVVSYDMNESEACIYNSNANMITDQSPNGFGGQLINFSLTPGCTSNYSPGRNLDSDQNGFGDGCDYGCGAGLTKLYVDSSATSGNNLGSSWADAYTSLSTALFHAVQCTDIDSVYVAEGTYVPDISGFANPRTASFLIPEGVQILGQFPSGGGTLSQRDTLHETILSGDIGAVGDILDNVYHVVSATNITSQSSVDGFAIMEGIANGGGIDNFGGGWLNDGASPRISNCKFIGNRAVAGGGSLLNFNSSSMISNCFFSDCFANRGGAMYNELSSLQISDCTFRRNKAIDQSLLGQGGAVSNLSSAPIFDACTFTANTATNGGGIAASDSSTVTLLNCQFTNDTAWNAGAGVFLNSSALIVENSIFNINAAYQGGGIYGEIGGLVMLTTCQFTNNVADRGAGVYLNTTPLVAENVSFNANQAGYLGGGIHSQNADSMVLMNCQFTNNFGGTFGGGISLIEVSLHAQDLLFTGNSANNGGGLYSLGGSVTLLDCQFTDNAAVLFGGGMALSQVPLSAQEVLFTGNSAYNAGGGLYCQYGSVSLLDCQFTSNNTTQTGSPYSFGGGVYVNNSPATRLSFCDFSGNSATGGGGGLNIFSSGGAGASQVNNCTFRSNFVDNGAGIGTGGGFQIFTPTEADLINCLFEDNRALGSVDDGGGAIMIYEGEVNLINSTVVNNYAATKGGAVSLFNNTCTLNSQNSIFWNNISATDSLVYNGNSGSATMNHSLIDADSCINNVLCNTGMIYNQDPQFIDSFDFRLQTCSPAINTGDTAGISNQMGLVDLDSMPRFEPSQIDIGAYEYQGIIDAEFTENNALSLDGIDDYVSIGANCVPEVFFPGGDAITIEYWFKGSNSQSAIRMQRPSGSIYIVSAWNNSKHILSNDGLTANGLPVGAGFNDGNWHHIAFTWERNRPNGFKSYLDGVLIAQRQSSDTPLPAIYSNQAFLGSYYGISQFTMGTIDEVKIWKNVRNQNQLLSSICEADTVGLLHYYSFDHGMANVDNSAVSSVTNLVQNNAFNGQLNDFALNGNTSNFVEGAQQALDIDSDGLVNCVDLCPDDMDTALDFDGIDDHVSIPHNDSLNILDADFAMQAWIYSTNTDFETILSKGSGGVNTNFVLQIASVTHPATNGQLSFYFAGEWRYSSAMVPKNTWTHVAISFNATTKLATFFINGAVDTSHLYMNIPNNVDPNSLYIGRQGYNCACNHFEGRIDDVAVWSKMRSAAEIADDMSGGIYVNEPGLVVYYDMNESAACHDNTSSTMIIDQSANGFGGILANFDLLPGCTSNWSSGRNLDSDQDGIGDGCDYRCNIGSTVLYTDESAQSGNNLGTTWGDAYESLSEALKHAATCPEIDSIHVATGIYVPDTRGLVNPRKASFLIPEGVHILGRFPSGGGTLLERDSIFETILTGDIDMDGDSLDNVYHVVTATNISSQSSVDGFTITKGFANGEGGDANGAGWSNVNASTRISNCTFMDNHATMSGGGLYSTGGSVSLLDCQFTLNTASIFGGGAYVLSSPLIAQNVAFTSNSSDYSGGGLMNWNSSVSLMDCQFNMNTATSYGGGVSLGAAALTAHNVAFAENSSLYGGGLYSQTDSVSLTDCQFTMNMSSGFGGGVALFSGVLAAQNVMFSNNASLWGGGLFHSGASLLNCQFSENTSTAGGGGVSSYITGVSQVEDCIFRFNQAIGDTLGTGGAYQADGTGQTNFTNCLFEANQVLGSGSLGGGAIDVYAGEVRITNSTVINNQSATFGGAISIRDSSGVATVTNTILWNNTATADSMIYNINGGSAYINYSLFDADNCLPNVSCGPGMIYNIDPLFVDVLSAPPLGGDFSLRYQSPAINAGINDSIPAGNTTDLNGINRILNTTVDMGAYEFNYEFPCGLYGNLAIDDVPVFMGDYKANGLISSAGIVNTNSNGPVSFKSESEIELNQGFEVQLGEEFNAVIEDPCVD